VEKTCYLRRVGSDDTLVQLIWEYKNIVTGIDPMTGEKEVDFFATTESG
jgi:hypothetical protein